MSANPFDDLWRTVELNIAEYGWHVTGVFPLVDDPVPGPPFTYSVGLAEQGFPELIVFGLTSYTAHGLLGTLVDWMQEGQRLTPGPVDHVAEGFRCWLVDTPEDRALEYATMAYVRAEGRSEGIRVMQLVWPDHAGRFPWDEGCVVEPMVQPVLGEAP